MEKAESPETLVQYRIVHWTKPLLMRGYHVEMGKSGAWISLPRSYCLTRSGAERYLRKYLNPYEHRRVIALYSSDGARIDPSGSQD